MEVCRAVNRILLRRTLTLGKVCDIVADFAQMGFPNCGGVIDGTHIPILAPDHLASKYINQKGYFSMVLQVLVDHCGRFIDISAGWSGKVHDARIFWNTGLKITVREVEMPIVILGDPTYPLMPWLMKSYTGALTAARSIDCAFGHLKGRWCCLYGKLDLADDSIPTVISVCCTLHNICEGKDESFIQAWTLEFQHLETEFEQPETRAIRGAQRGLGGEATSVGGSWWQ
ncbi:unnamed protein product [Eretmochelys imbricata]